jgi:hypothetical protein
MGWKRTFVEACLIVVACAALAPLINAFHPRGIPLVAHKEYETLVPCPEPGGEVLALEASDPALHDRASFFVDARGAEQAARWRYREAVSVPYDYLDPTPEETLKELARSIARSGAQRVVVYGDGDDPDTGELLGREISGHGIRNVHFVRGGAPALEAQDGAGEGAP